MIERIRIRNFRSLRDVEVRLAPLTVLIGRSGSGKSNFVRAVRLLRDMLSNQFNWHTAFQNAPFTRGGSLAYEIDISVRGIALLSYSVEFVRTHSAPHCNEKLMAGDRVIFHQENQKWVVPPPVTPHPNPHSVVLGLLSGVREATIAHVAISRGVGCYDFPGTVLQVDAPIEQAPGYNGSGDTPNAIAARIIDALDRIDDWDAVGRSIAALNRRVVSLDLVRPERKQFQVGYDVSNGKALQVDVAQESEGFRRYLAHLLALYQTPPKQTMFFEHPESGIHPGALQALSDEFKSHVADGRGQVILTTHSPQMLDHFEPEQLRVVVMDGDQTRIGPLAADQMDNLRGNLMTPGELLTVDPARIDPAPVAEAGA